MRINVVDGVCCPLCGGHEVLLGGPVRPFKVHADHTGWASNCTDCDIWFSEDGTKIEVDLRFIEKGVQWWTVERLANCPPSDNEKLDALITKCREKLNG